MTARARIDAMERSETRVAAECNENIVRTSDRWTP